MRVGSECSAVAVLNTLFPMPREIFDAAETGDSKMIEDFLSGDGDIDICDEVFPFFFTLL
jgi:hypothetical protein